MTREPSDIARKPSLPSRETMARVGARVRSLRFRLDRSEASFAGLIGVDADIVRMWERGEGLDREALIRIASATDTEMERLIAGLTPVEVEAMRAAARVRPPSPAAADGDPIVLRRVIANPAPAASIASGVDAAPGGPAAGERAAGAARRKTRKRR